MTSAANREQRGVFGRVGVVIACRQRMGRRLRGPGDQAPYFVGPHLLRDVRPRRNAGVRAVQLRVLDEDDDQVVGRQPAGHVAAPVLDLDGAFGQLGEKGPCSDREPGGCQDEKERRCLEPATPHLTASAYATSRPSSRSTRMARPMLSTASAISRSFGWKCG